MQNQEIITSHEVRADGDIIVIAVDHHWNESQRRVSAVARREVNKLIGSGKKAIKVSSGATLGELRTETRHIFSISSK